MATSRDMFLCIGSSCLTAGALVLASRFLGLGPAAFSEALPSPEATMALIRTRRSIFAKDYIPAAERQVDRETIEAMVEAANWAPTHHKTEPWMFRCFYSHGAREYVGQLAQAQYKATAGDKFAANKYEGKLNNAMRASCIIAICIKRGGVKGAKGAEKCPLAEEVMATACAVQNMHLMATAQGVGAYWSTGGVINDAAFVELLELDVAAGDSCIGLFFVGHSDRMAGYRGARGPASDKVQWE